MDSNFSDICCYASRVSHLQASVKLPQSHDLAHAYDKLHSMIAINCLHKHQMTANTQGVVDL
jgi:hypothetical protein